MAQTEKQVQNIPRAFYKKPVLQLTCRFCDNRLCSRGMKAILLADTTMELYSTDFPPECSIQPIWTVYRTGKCECRIKDVGCVGCGNNVGYHVVQPCRACLRACNNGHLWMFYNNTVRADPVFTSDGAPMLWENLVSDSNSGSRDGGDESAGASTSGASSNSVIDDSPLDDDCCR